MVKSNGTWLSQHIRHDLVPFHYLMT